MAFKAMFEGDLVCIVDRDLRGWATNGYVCCMCNGDMQLVAKSSKFVSPHFRHLTGGNHPGESPEHREAKIALYHELGRIYSREEGYVIDIEHKLTLENGDLRFIDVAVLHKGQVMEAHEAQFSTQSDDDFILRTQTYANLGIQTIWYLGNKNNNTHTKNLCLELCGVYGEFVTS